MSSIARLDAIRRTQLQVRAANRAKLTPEQRREAASLVADAGYSRSEAVALVLAGFGEPQS